MSGLEEYANFTRFGKVVAEVELHLREWMSGNRTQPPDIEQFPVPVYLKNRDRVLTLVNSSYQTNFSNKELPIGKHSDSVLAESIAKVSAASDSIILDGYSRLELDHVGVGLKQRWYLMRTHKVDLSDYRYEPYAILGISIPIRVLENPEERKADVADLFAIYDAFARIDRQICTLYALGETTRAIAERLGVSTRTVENHRASILKQLGLSKPVEIIRLLVRFEERGLVSDFAGGLEANDFEAESPPSDK